MKSKGHPNMKAIDRVHTRQLKQSMNDTDPAGRWAGPIGVPVDSISQATELYIKGRVEEFHNRLKLNIKKLTCDVPKTREEFDTMLVRYSDNKYKDDLLVILWKEILQVIQAVEEAK